MNIQEQLTKKQEELKKTVEEINQFQQALNIKNQDALRVDGAIKQLQELLKEEEEVKVGDK